MAARAFGTNGTIELNGASFVRTSAQPDNGGTTPGDVENVASDEFDTDGADIGLGSDDSTIDPESLAGNTAGDPAPYGYTASGRVRKRPVASAGSGSTPRTGTRSTGTKAASDLKQILFSLHMMGATFLSIPQMMISEEESEALGTAINRVTDQYDIPLMDEKSRAWINLGIVAAQVYGTRLASVVIEKKQRKPRVVNTIPFQQANG